MAKPKQLKQYKLDMFGRVLPALDKHDINFYNTLTEEEKKAYTPLVLMRAMSSLCNQNPHAAFEILMVNDLVNIGFWNLSKHPELQHMLLCIAGLGNKQYHPWIAAKGKGSNTKIIDDFLIELHPDINIDELALLRSQHNVESIKLLAQDAGKSDSEIKLLVEDAKKLT
jgi:hypothetical protein